MSQLQCVRVVSHSMEPTIADGSIALIMRVELARAIGIAPRAGRIVVFRTPGPGSLAVKRVVGVEGDRLQYGNGRLIRNGTVVREDYLPSTMQDDTETLDSRRPIQVPKDAFYVLGDNRRHSIDSRHWGFVDRDAIVGVVLASRPRVTASETTGGAK